MVVVRLKLLGIRLGSSERHMSTSSMFYGGVCIEKREIH